RSCRYPTSRLFIACRIVIAAVLVSCVPSPWSPLFPYTTLFRSSAVSYFPCKAANKIERIGDNSFHVSILEDNCFKGFCCLLKGRSEEHTSELQSRFDVVCGLLLEKKNDRQASNDWNYIGCCAGV